MNIETVEDLANQIADWMGVYGCCKQETEEGTKPELCQLLPRCLLLSPRRANKKRRVCRKHDFKPPQEITFRHGHHSQ
jgi:hypothetical protein